MVRSCGYLGYVVSVLVAVSTLNGAAPRQAAAQEESRGDLVFASSTITYLIGGGGDTRLDAPEVGVNGVYDAAMKYELKRATLVGRMLITDLAFGTNSPGSIDAEWRRSVKGKPARKLARASEPLGGNDRFVRFFVDKPARKLKNAVLSANYKARNGRYVAPSMVQVASAVDLRASLGRIGNGPNDAGVKLGDYDQEGLRLLSKSANTQAVSASASYELQPDDSGEIFFAPPGPIEAGYELLDAAAELVGTTQKVCIRFRLSNSTPGKPFLVSEALFSTVPSGGAGTRVPFVKFKNKKVGEDLEKTIKLDPQNFLNTVRDGEFDLLIKAANDPGTQLFVEMEITVPGNTAEGRFAR